MPETKKKRKRSQKQRRAMKRYAVVLTALVAVIAVLTGMTIAGRVNRADPLDALPSDIRDDGSLRVYLKSLARPDALGLTLEEILQANIDKLRARYPEGFSTEKSLHRKELDQ